MHQSVYSNDVYAVKFPYIRFLKHLFIYLLCLFYLPVHGQNNVVLSDADLGTSFATQAGILEDKEHLLSIDDILNKKEVAFKNIHHSVEKIEFTTSVFWIKFDISNNTDFTSFVLETARLA